MAEAKPLNLTSPKKIPVYLRLGPKRDGYNSSIHLQTQNKVFSPPRMKTIDLTSLRRELKSNTRIDL